jgi:hypothetical protein
LLKVRWDDGLKKAEDEVAVKKFQTKLACARVDDVTATNNSNGGM